jgi:hypothetical protein
VRAEFHSRIGEFANCFRVGETLELRREPANVTNGVAFATSGILAKCNRIERVTLDSDHGFTSITHRDKVRDFSASSSGVLVIQFGDLLRELQEVVCEGAREREEASMQ